MGQFRLDATGSGRRGENGNGEALPGASKSMAELTLGAESPTEYRRVGADSARVISGAGGNGGKLELPEHTDGPAAALEGGGTAVLTGTGHSELTKAVVAPAERRACDGEAAGLNDSGRHGAEALCRMHGRRRHRPLPRLETELSESVCFPTVRGAAARHSADGR